MRTLTDNNCAGATVCALARETLADSEAELHERLAGLQADVRAYRELVQRSLDALHKLTRQHQRCRGRRGN